MLRHWKVTNKTGYPSLSLLHTWMNTEVINTSFLQVHCLFKRVIIHPSPNTFVCITSISDLWPCPWDTRLFVMSPKRRSTLVAAIRSLLSALTSFSSQVWKIYRDGPVKKTKTAARRSEIENDHWPKVAGGNLENKQCDNDYKYARLFSIHRLQAKPDELSYPVIKKKLKKIDKFSRLDWIEIRALTSPVPGLCLANHVLHT